MYMGKLYKERLQLMKVAFLLFCSFNFTVANSQSLKLGFLFKPGIALGMESMAEAKFSDTSFLSMSNYNGQLTIPLKTKINFRFRESNVKGHQTFLNYNIGIRETVHKESPYETFQTQTHAIGFTSLRAGLKTGIWLVSGNIYLSESKESFSKPKINGMGYLVKIKAN